MDIIFSKLKSLQENKKTKNNWNISWQLATFLSNFVKLQQPKNILEVGTSNGFSTLAIARYLNKNSKITTIEINKQRFQEAQDNFKYCKLDNINQILGNAVDITYNLNDKFDLIFLDAGQMFYKKIIENILNQKVITKNSYIIADNVKSHQNMNEFLEYMNLNFECELLNFDSGFLIAKNILN